MSLTYSVVILLLLSNIPRDKFLNSLLDKNLSKKNVFQSEQEKICCFLFIVFGKRGIVKNIHLTQIFGSKVSVFKRIILFELFCVIISHDIDYLKFLIILIET